MIGDFEIGFSKKNESWNMRKYHYHDCYEIYYLLNGDRRYYIENRSYDVKKGSILFINKNNIHKTMNSENAGHERILIYFSDQMIHQFDSQDIDFLMSPFHRNNKMLELNMQEQNYVESLLFQMQNEHAGVARPGRSMYFQTLLVQLLLFSARKMMDEPKVSLNLMNAKIAEIIAYINENSMNRLSLHSISEKFHISPFYFSRLFKQTTGFTFTEYITTLRIRDAQRLIRESGHKIIQISEQVGFSNISHFNRKFKQVTTMCPLEYKRMVKNSNYLYLK
ncbi:MAG: AraC family transcriptional regulator [Bacilli bacterium]|nr:AraC family transcriptional regulator [Bacilli bacterium]